MESAERAHPARIFYRAVVGRFPEERTAMLMALAVCLSALVLYVFKRLTASTTENAQLRMQIASLKRQLRQR
jgi:hypothetical protein